MLLMHMFIDSFKRNQKGWRGYDIRILNTALIVKIMIDYNVFTLLNNVKSYVQEFDFTVLRESLKKNEIQ